MINISHKFIHYYQHITQFTKINLENIKLVVNLSEIPKGFGGNGIETFDYCTEKDYCDKLHKWLTFLINPEGKEMDLLKKEDNEIKEAMDILYQISGDKELVQLAEIRDKAIRDENDRLEGSREEGRKEGIKQGVENEKNRYCIKAEEAWFINRADC